jgi:uncharacterized peroxidase-related enzyme
MPRLPQIDPGQATGQAKELLLQVQQSLRVVPNMTRAMANSPAVLAGYLAFSGALQGGALPAKLREQLALAVAERNSCGYCLAAHATIGKMVGLAPADIEASRSLDLTDPKARAALRFAAAILEGRGEVSDDEFARVRHAGFGDAEIAEIIAHVALNVFTNYFNKAIEVTIDFPPVGTLATR